MPHIARFALALALIAGPAGAQTVPSGELGTIHFPDLGDWRGAGRVSSPA